MRRTLTSTLLFLALAACGDGEGEDAYIRASIDGATWIGAAVEGEVVYTVPGSTVFMRASRRATTTEEAIYLGFPYPLALGTYVLGDSLGSAAWSVCPRYGDGDCGMWGAVPDDPGTLTITAIDPGTGRIEGTFEFTGYFRGDPLGETRQFTAGHFVVLAPSIFILE